jgi:hypothetical protein
VIRLYIFDKADRSVVEVFECASQGNPADAAAGCEHAAGERYRGSEYAWTYSLEAEGLDPGYALQEAITVPPLSRADPRKISKAEAQEHLESMRRAEVERLKSLGVDVD